MLIDPPAHGVRPLRLETLSADVAVVGGGLAGVCAAITAARAGARVVLVQDRPVLGGNASSEVRLWILGATSHMGNNNRWAREGGVIDELLVENTFRNPEGNPLILDALLLEMAVAEPNLVLLLNTAVHALEKSDADTIQCLRAFNAQNSTAYELTASLFIDASGDGIVGFLAGAAFRMGAEARSELGEPFAPALATRELLGHTLYFYSKDTGRPVKFTPPGFALLDIAKIPRWRDIQLNDTGCRLWWLEWGGAMDTVYDCERIKWELWRVAYGVWNHIKNSGRFPEAETLTLEWVGTIPGKRESRRFEGDYMLCQQDIVGQRPHADAVSYGGWAIDLHPAEGVFSPQSPCQQWHAKGIYPIPYRCLYSREVKNLFLAGRLISASHIAFGSTRVMATCAQGGQVVGMAAAICAREKLQPRDLLASARLQGLQRDLLRNGQFIPGVALEDETDLVCRARLTPSSELRLSQLEPNGETLLLEAASAMMLPVQGGSMPAIELLVDASAPTTLQAELRVSSRPDNYTPDLTLATQSIRLEAGLRIEIPLQFDAKIESPRYAFVCLRANPHVAVHLSEWRITGVLAVTQKFNRAVAKSSSQEPPPGSGIDRFEFWIPARRPGGKNFAMKICPPLEAFGACNLTNGVARPTTQPNAWVADLADQEPTLRLVWDQPQRISRIELSFDTDFDHPMESVLMGHPERVMPFCLRDVIMTRPAGRGASARGRAGDAGGGPHAVRGCEVFRITENHQTRRVICLPSPVVTDELELRLIAPQACVPAALFALRCFADV